MVSSVSEANIKLSDLAFLVVDDDPVILDLTTQILATARAGKVNTARDGQEAFEKLMIDNGHYDIIICDLNMPGMNGVEFLERLSDISFKGGILLLSGKDNRLLESASELARAHRLNVIGTISKEHLVTKMINRIMQNYVPNHETGGRPVPSSISEEELRAGLAGSALTIYYQPKINIHKGCISGVEVLSRWQHPLEGILPPSSFIPLAESTGLIHDLTYSVYDMAVTQIKQWQQESIHLHFSINISANSLGKPQFYQFIINRLKEHNLDPNLVILEVTEREIMTDITQSLASLMNLRMQNFGLSIDDFGTGYSSMEKLKMIPFTELKLDRSFVTDVSKRPSAQVILESSISLARKLNMEIVAEGVESRDDWDIVSALCCDYVQGFYCARPMPAEELFDFYRSWNGPP